MIDFSIQCIKRTNNIHYLIDLYENKTFPIIKNKQKNNNKTDYIVNKTNNIACFILLRFILIVFSFNLVQN